MGPAHPLSTLEGGARDLLTKTALPSPAPLKDGIDLTPGDEIPDDDLDAPSDGQARKVVRLRRVPDPPLRHRVVRAVVATRTDVAQRGSGFTNGPGDLQRPSLTTGSPERNGRGLTSGWGMVNGTGMTREPEHHVPRGRFNGSGVTRSAALASRDGMTNGSGLTEAGMAAGEGMTNGSGLTQGRGMTNGNGLVMVASDQQPPLAKPAKRGGLLGRFVDS